jgi:hypothetical protein
MLDLEPIKALWLSGEGTTTIFISHIQLLVAEIEKLRKEVQEAESQIPNFFSWRNDNA